MKDDQLAKMSGCKEFGIGDVRLLEEGERDRVRARA